MPLPISHIGLLTPRNYAENHPLRGLEQTLQQLAYGEMLGFDSAWVRQRHLAPGISSAPPFWPPRRSAPAASSWARPSSRSV